MKKLLAAALAALVLISGCSKDPEESPEPSAEPTASAEASQEPAPEPEPTPEPARYSNPLTGEPMYEDPGDSRPYAVMINNISSAMPQCGISGADIVYEMLAEGGITRMMAIFSDISGAGTLGSIRSIRPYYIDVAQAYDAIIVHAGGSEQAYYDLSSKSIDNLDGVRGTYGESIFYRDSSRMYAGYEHSLFTTSDRVLEYTPKLELREEHEHAFDNGLFFKEDGTPSDSSSAASISVNFSGYKSTGFTYSEEDGLYYVRQHNQDYIDGNTGEKVGFTNVIVLLADTVTLADEYAHLDVNLTGTGTGYFACGGKQTGIEWRNGYSGGSFSYTVTSTGSRLYLGQGTTFICVIPNAPGSSVNFE